MAGVHSKVVQTVMRHSTITLTMDTYGHLFPGQEADAVARLRDMMATNQPETMQAIGTDVLTVQQDDGEQRASRCAARITRNKTYRCEALRRTA